MFYSKIPSNMSKEKKDFMSLHKDIKLERVKNKH